MPFVGSEITQPAIEQPGGHRIQPDAVMAIATEFSSLLREVQVRDLGPENRRRLIDVLDAFEQLFVEMRDTSAAIRATPER